MTVQEMYEELVRLHLPNPPASLQEIEEFEERVGWRLDPDMRAFYLRCNGAQLFRTHCTIAYWFLPLSQIVRARVAMRGEDDDQYGPASMYAICDVQDGNYIVADVSRQENGRYPLIDGFHETFPDPEDCQQVASSFSEFLEKALRSEGFQFWLG